MNSFRGISNANINGDYQENGEGILAMNVSDTVQILRVEPGNTWAWAYNETTGQLGHVPLKHIEKLPGYDDPRYEAKPSNTPPTIPVAPILFSSLVTASLDGRVKAASSTDRLLTGKLRPQEMSMPDLALAVSTLCRSVRGQETEISTLERTIRSNKTKFTKILHMEREKHQHQLEIVELELSSAKAESSEAESLRQKLRKMRRLRSRGGDGNGGSSVKARSPYNQSELAPIIETLPGLLNKIHQFAAAAAAGGADVPSAPS
jgi:hypothetical protein